MALSERERDRILLDLQARVKKIEQAVVVEEEAPDQPVRVRKRDPRKLYAGNGPV